MNLLHLHKSTQKYERRKGKVFSLARGSLFVLHLIFYLMIIFLIGAVILLFVSGAIFLPSAVNVYSKAMAGKEQIEKIEISFKEFIPEREEMIFPISILSSLAKENFQESKESLRNLDFFRKIPGLRNQYIALDNLLGAAVETTSCLEEMAVWLENIPFLSRPSLEKTSKCQKEILEYLFNSKSFWPERKKEIKIAQDLLSPISSMGPVRSIQRITQDFQKKLSLLEGRIDEAESFFQFLPLAVGLDKEKNYLFLLQNNDELRPSGGFLGTYGILKIKNGEILSFETDDVYNLDKNLEGSLEIEPPWPLKKYNKIPFWFMRDANWSPDFPTSAQKIEWFYKMENRKKEDIDGVIAIDQNFVEDLFGLTGPIKIKNITFEKDNFVDLLQHEVEQAFWRRGIPKEERKRIIQDLAEEMRKRIFDLPINQWPRLYKIVDKNLKEKHILFYFHEPDLENHALAKNWGGQVQEFEGDYIMVVDANLASLKTDPVVERFMIYDLRFTNGERQAKLTITYDHQGKFDWKTTRYRTYTRVYLPEGSEVSKVSSYILKDHPKDPQYYTIARHKLGERDKKFPGISGDTSKQIEVTQELGKTVLGAFISIEPGEKKSLVFEYKLPEKIIKQIKNGEYRLLVQKQAGTEAHGLNLNLEFPQIIKSASPAEKQEEWGDNVYRLETDLGKDTQINLCILMKE